MKQIFLLADDDDDDRELFREALQAVDPSAICYFATTGEEAFDILSKKEKPHLFFLDINLPGMNGWQCLKTLKGMDAYKEIPVFMYSTSNHQRDVEIAFDLGALCFVTKPHSFSELKSILQVLTDNVHKGTFDDLVHFKNIRLKKMPAAPAIQQRRPPGDSA